MTMLTFVVTAHTAFRVGSAYARDGVDAAVDRDDPLPADHLKGVMRDAATRLLGLNHPCLLAVFGTARHPSPWAWTSAVAPGGWTFGRRHRVSIDGETHTAAKDLLVLGEHVWAPEAVFEVHRFRPLPPGTGSGYTEDDHRRLLRVAASGVHGLGSWRRRGLGWVGIRPQDGPVTAQEVAQVVSWRTTELAVVGVPAEVAR
jgi:hypothetical protein